MSMKKIGLDDLLNMSQDELEQRFNTLEGYLKREQRRGRRHEDLEVEVCYFSREMEWRNQVRENHKAYLEKNSQEDLFDN
jgi:hypothetical protein